MSVLWGHTRDLDYAKGSRNARETDRPIRRQTPVVRLGGDNVLEKAFPGKQKGAQDVATHTFKIVLDRQPSDAELDRLFEAGCADAAFGVERGLAVARFDREHDSLADAIASAIKEVESAGLMPVRVIDEDILTLADIADRIGQSRESVRRYAADARGPGGFPPPVNPGREGTVFYRWSEVAPWLRENLDLDVEVTDPTLTMANLVLQARRVRDRVPRASVLHDLLAS
jgi:hypothetical protein